VPLALAIALDPPAASDRLGVAAGGWLGLRLTYWPGLAIYAEAGGELARFGGADSRTELGLGVRLGAAWTP
jgi:hypothetical protein